MRAAVALILLFASTRAGAKTCFVSFLGDLSREQKLIAEARRLARAMAAPTLDFNVRFVIGVDEGVAAYTGLKSCLEDDAVDEVLVVAHSREEIEGKPSLLIPLAPNQGFTYFDDRVFTRVRAGAHLKMLTLITCQPHRVLDQYVNLRAWAARAGVQLRLAPIAPLKTWLYTQIYGRAFDSLTPLEAVPKLLAEAVQANPERSGRYFCYVYAADGTRPEALCAHGRLRIHLAPGGITSSPRWWYLVRARDGQSWSADLSEPGDVTQRVMDQDREGSLRFPRRELDFDFGGGRQ